jgi:hypothetical protein
MKTAPFVFSHENGVGKNLLIDLIGESLFSDFYIPITSKAQKSEFNSHKANALLNVCNESSYSGRLDLAEALKDEITNDTITINEKHKPQYRTRNYAELWLTSNRTDGVLIRDKDRRYAAFHALEKRIPPEEAKEYAKWWGGGGKNAVMHYLLHRDISQFNPYAPAPMNAFKQALIEDNRTPHQRLIAELAEDAGGRPLRELSELVDDKDVTEHRSSQTITVVRQKLSKRERKKEEQYLARELRTAGSEKRRLKLEGEKRVIWAVSHYEAWAKRSNEQWAAQWREQGGAVDPLHYALDEKLYEVDRAKTESEQKLKAKDGQIRELEAQVRELKRTKGAKGGR